MEHEYRLSPMSRLFEARHELRQHLALETSLIERICELPEDDFCHSARESFQLGAGYAYLQRGTDTPFETVFTAFFATQPQNRYLDPEAVSLARKEIADAALEFLETGEMPTIENHIDIYQVEASAAFTEGYVMAASMLTHESNETGVA